MPPSIHPSIRTVMANLTGQPLQLSCVVWSHPNLLRVFVISKYISMIAVPLMTVIYYCTFCDAYFKLHVLWSAILAILCCDCDGTELFHEMGSHRQAPEQLWPTLTSTLARCGTRASVAGLFVLWQLHTCYHLSHMLPPATHAITCHTLSPGTHAITCHTCYHLSHMLSPATNAITCHKCYHLSHMLPPVPTAITCHTCYYLSQKLSHITNAIICDKMMSVSRYLMTFTKLCFFFCLRNPGNFMVSFFGEMPYDEWLKSSFFNVFVTVICVTKRFQNEYFWMYSYTLVVKTRHYTGANFAYINNILSFTHQMLIQECIHISFLSNNAFAFHSYPRTPSHFTAIQECIHISFLSKNAFTLFSFLSHDTTTKLGFHKTCSGLYTFQRMWL